MSVYIFPERQIERVKSLRVQLEVYASLSESDFHLKRDAKSWDVAQVMQHMVIAQALYIPKIEEAFKAEDKRKMPEKEYKAQPIAAYLLKRFPPSDGKIRMKMKTMKIFEPGTAKGQHADLEDLRVALAQLQEWIERSQRNAFTRKRFSSAVGNLVRFNIPEALEFILCHNERHFQQIANILALHGKG
jgi:hypothetical protein